MTQTTSHRTDHHPGRPGTPAWVPAVTIAEPAEAMQSLPAGHRTQPERHRILLVASNGGHLAQLVSLRPWADGNHATWVTFRKPDAESQLAGERVVWAHYPTTRNIPNLLRNLLLAARVVRRSRFDVIVSTGAAVALPFFLVGRLLRIPTVYIEVYDRIDAPTLTARLCRPITSLFLVQWPEQLRFFPGARVAGPLL